VVAQLRYDIPKLYSFHTSESLDVEVDFMRFEGMTNGIDRTDGIMLSTPSAFENRVPAFKGCPENDTTEPFPENEYNPPSSGDLGGIDRRVFRKAKSSNKGVSSNKSTLKKGHPTKGKKHKR
jgi:hypothetical protein